MATAKDLTKLQHAYVDRPMHFYYEQAADGTRTLHHIRVNQCTYNAPADGSGITIDVVPPNAVSSAQIQDGSIQTEDISPDALADHTDMDEIFNS